jgi:hypothetical protein
MPAIASVMGRPQCAGTFAITIHWLVPSDPESLWRRHCATHDHRRLQAKMAEQSALSDMCKSPALSAACVSCSSDKRIARAVDLHGLLSMRRRPSDGEVGVRWRCRVPRQTCAHLVRGSIAPRDEVRRSLAKGRKLLRQTRIVGT